MDTKQKASGALSGVASTLPPADLEIRVTTRDDGNALSFDYELHSPNGRFHLAYSSFPGGRLRHPADWQKRILKIFENLRKGLDSRGTYLDSKEVVTDLAAIGEDLSDELFPPELQRTLQEVRQAETVLLVTDDPWIPWEIVKPYEDTELEGGQEDEGFLASRQLTRWLPGGQPPAAYVDVRRLAVIEAGSPPDQKKLKKTIDELRFLAELAVRHDVKDESLTETGHASVLSLLEEQDLGLVHLGGHGEHDVEDPGASGFYLHDGRTLRPRDLRRKIQARLRKNRPLVFLNACEAGRQSWSLTRPGGWARSFVLGCGCGAFVAPQWPVGDDTAYDFATTFYKALEQGLSFGQATLTARHALPKDSLGRLAYAVYAHPNGRLRLGGRGQIFPEDPRQRPFSPASFYKSASAPRRDRHASGRRTSNLKRRLVGLTFFLLLAFLALGIKWHLGNQPQAGESLDPPEPAVQLRGEREDDSVSTPTIDIHALQKPPYRADAASFYVQLPNTVDAAAWRKWIESTAETQLATVGLNLTRSTSAAWLVVLTVSPPTRNKGATGRICNVQAQYEVYHERQPRTETEIFFETASQFTDDDACRAVVYKVANRVTRNLLTVYFDSK